MTARFVIEEGALKGLVFALEEKTAKENQWTLGRDPELCQLVVEDPAVSRSHLLLRLTPDGIEVENLSETNPTLLNDAEVAENQLLKEGDALKIGSNLYRFYLAETPVVETSEEEPPSEERESIFELEEEAGDAALSDVDLDLIDAAPWLLKVVSGPNNGAQFSMHPNTSYVIGTDPSACDIVFHDVSVSRRHARLTIGGNGVLTIEDLESSNGTIIEGKKIEERVQFEPNILISLGTSTFIVCDRESERQTVISPLLPAIVKVLKEGEEKKEIPEGGTKEETEHEETEAESVKKSSRGFLMVVGGIAVAVLIGISLLFVGQEVDVQPVNIEKTLEEVLASYPVVKYTYNPSTGRLTLVGHVKTAVENAQIVHDLDPLNFIAEVDNNITIDEYIWNETKQYLSKNWKGVTLNIPSAGEYILTGTLKTKREATSLSDYMNTHFPFLERLDNRVVVEEDIIDQIKFYLRKQELNKVQVSLANREVSLTGTIAYGEMPKLQNVIAQAREVPGVTKVFSFVTETRPIETMVNLTRDYDVSGSLTGSDGKITVIVNGRSVREGDFLDGRLVTKIEPNTIFLELGDQKYRIDYK